MRLLTSYTISMKRLFITLFSIIVVTAHVFAQQADSLVGGLINAGDWFELQRVYPDVKDKVQTPMLKQMAEVMLASNFNRPQELREKLPRLIAAHQAEIGFESVCNMVITGATVEGFNGNYAAAADMVKNIADAVKGAGGSLQGSGIEELLKYYDAIRNLPAPVLKKPDTDVKIALSAASDTLLYIPVNINGKTYDFILDTGASLSLISLNLAKEIGAQMVENSIFVGGATGGGNLQRAFIEEMNIGPISYKNVLTFVDNSPAPAEVSFTVDAILGMDFIKRLGEIQIDMVDMTLVIPAHRTATPGYGRNILLDQNIPIVEVVDARGNRVTFTLDTGHSGADLSDLWFSKNAKTTSDLPIETQNSWGHGGISRRQIVKVPEYTLTIGDTPATFNSMPAHIPVEGTAVSSRDGNLGIELLKKFKRIIINLDEMFVKFEQPL